MKMNNIKAINRFDRAHSASISKLFWIAGSINERDLFDLITDMHQEGHLNQIIPGLELSDEVSPQDVIEELIDRNAFGLLAEVHHPIASGFMFNDKGKPTGWSVNQGRLHISYHYAEDMNGLLKSIEAAAEQWFNKDVEAAKKLNP